MTRKNGLLAAFIVFITFCCVGKCSAQFYIESYSIKKKSEKVGWAIEIRADSVFFDFDEYKGLRVLNVSRIRFNTVYELESDTSKVFLWMSKDEIHVYERFQKWPERLTIYYKRK